MPGDPVRFALGENARPDQIAQLTREMGLDRPYWVQYGRLLVGIANGDFGMSLSTFRPISGDLAVFLPASIELALLALGVSVLLGVPLGVITAVNRNKLSDSVGRALAFAGVALPVFWFALMIQQMFATNALGMRWLPTVGRIHVDRKPPPEITGSYLLDSLLVLDFSLLWHVSGFIVLPAVALAVSPMAMILRLLRASMIDEMGRDYVLTARANGMPSNLLTYTYMLRNAFSATLTIIGLLFGYFIGGAFIIETVFSWPGIGRYGVRALQLKDFNAIVAVTLIVGLGYAAANTLVTLAYGWLDPRLRFHRT
jgi:peptide/nickel transport system permease protein